MPSIKSLGEFGLIKLLERQSKFSSTIYTGIGDDAAVVASSGTKRMVLTTDMLLEGVHFTRKMSYISIGHKAIGCSLSDIAAMGAIPKYAMVSIGLPQYIQLNIVKEIYEGMNKLARRFDTKIVGGDTINSEKIIINIAMVGEAPKEDVVTRNGAKTEDLIYITGPLGDSFASGRHLKFVPRISESQQLVKKYKPTSMIDVSDGLAADLHHILSASNKGAILYEDRIPLAKNATIDQALYDGEDYELLFTLAPHVARKLNRSKSKFPFVHIGEVTKTKTCYLVNSDGRRKIIKDKGYTHF